MILSASVHEPRFDHVSEHVSGTVVLKFNPDGNVYPSVDMYFPGGRAEAERFANDVLDAIANLPDRPGVVE